MSSSKSINVLLIGGSRNIGYFAALLLLEAGANVTFLLRSPSAFDADTKIQEYVKRGKAHLVKGDALVREGAQAAWDAAGRFGHVDYLLSTVGGIPKFSMIHGAVLDPPNLVTTCLLTVLSTMPVVPGHNTRIITLSSTGLTKRSHAALPLALKPVYAYLLKSPHKDKVGPERVVAHCAGWDWSETQEKEPGADIMGSDDWRETAGLPAHGSLARNFLVVRPAWLTDGEEPKPYRVSEDEIGGWSISRRDVARFIADAMLNKWSEYENKRVNIAY